MLINLEPESVLGSPPGGEFFVGRHQSTEVVVAVWRRWAKLDGVILIVVDGAREGEASGGGLGRWEGPWATVR